MEIVVLLILIVTAFKLSFILNKISLKYYRIKFYFTASAFGRDVDVTWRLTPLRWFIGYQSSYKAVQCLVV